MTESTTTEPLSILFVDDEPSVLHGLRRSLRSKRHEWSMEFCEGGADALEWLSKNPVDVVLSDMRMPEMDGAELLGEVRRLSPSSARIILSGYAERESLLRSARVAHQFLNKPCEVDEIRATIERIARCRRSVPLSDIRDLVGSVASLPTPGTVHEDLRDVMAGDYDVDGVAAVLSADVALSAEILRLVNTPFFGSVQPLVSVSQAVGLLGSDVLTAIVAARTLYVEEEDVSVDLEDVNAHCRVTAEVAAKFAEVRGASKSEQSEVFAAGLLHDIGVLVLARSESFGEETNLAEVLAMNDVIFERLRLGADRFAVAQHLLTLWGFSDRVADAVGSLGGPVENAANEGLGWMVRVAHETLISGAISGAEGLSATADELGATLFRVENELIAHRSPGTEGRSVA